MMPPAFKALLLRYNQLGRLLPPVGDDEIAAAVAIEDPETRAACTVVLKEMERVKAQIDAMLDAANAELERNKIETGRD
jgi:hypothetical protein